MEFFFFIAARFAVCVKQWLDLSVASTAVLLAKVAVVDSSEVSMSTVYSRYNGSGTLPWCTPTLTQESCVYSVLAYTRKCLL
jgi:hypothetical protein